MGHCRWELGSFLGSSEQARHLGNTYRCSFFCWSSNIYSRETKKYHTLQGLKRIPNFGCLLYMSLYFSSVFLLQRQFLIGVLSLGGKGNKFVCCRTVSVILGIPLGNNWNGDSARFSSICQSSQPAKISKFIHAYHQVSHLAKLTYFLNQHAPRRPNQPCQFSFNPRSKVVLHWSTTEGGLWFQLKGAKVLPPQNVPFGILILSWLLKNKTLRKSLLLSPFPA